MKDDQKILEDILVAQVLLLSRSFDAEKRANGTQRIGGDYIKEAVSAIKRSRSAILQKLQSE